MGLDRPVGVYLLITEFEFIPITTQYLDKRCSMHTVVTVCCYLSLVCSLHASSVLHILVFLLAMSISRNSLRKLPQVFKCDKHAKK